MTTQDEDRRALAHIRALMAATGEGMIVVSPDRTVRLVNERASGMLGFGRDGAIGEPAEALGIPEVTAAIDAAIDENASGTTRFTHRDRDLAATVAPYAEGPVRGAVITIRDESETAAVRRRSEAILSSTSDGLVVFDTDGRITFVNAAAEQMLGRGAETLVGVVTAPWNLVGLEQPRDSGVCGPDSHMREVRFEEPQHRIVDVRVDPVLDHRGAYIGCVETLRDVTAEREAAQMKNEFVSTVSHELRTPLTSIKGYIDLIIEGEAGEINEIQREFLGIVKENSDRLVDLINDMLDISRIESGRIVLKVQPLDVAERIEGAVNTFRAVLDQQGRAITVDVPADLPKAAGDPDRVGQVLINFISNAIKYSPDGGNVDVRATCDGSRVRVAIRDHGIGITPQDQERLFTKFYRVDSSLTREIGGTGLGLSICKSIIELLGGEVGVESTPGEGSTFFFTLPVAPSELVRTPALECPLDSPGGTILVVDNSEECANLIEAYLTARCYEVVKAFTAEDAWRLARETKPRAITLDVLLDEGAGFELLQDLKADPETRDIPVVVLSILCDEGKSARLGATGYLEKPIDRERLIDLIDKLVGPAATAVVLVVDDDRDIVDVLSRTLRQRGHAVMAAYDGREAMAAVARQRPDAILLDLRMPVMDGYEVLEALKSDPDTRDIPVAIMSAHNFDQARADVLKLATVQVSKPFDVEDLLVRVESAISEGEA